MTEKFGGGFENNPGDNPHKKVKEQLEVLRKKIIEKGGSEKLLAQWDSVSDKIDSGKEREVLDFLETLKFKKSENIETWRKTVYGLSRSTSSEISAITTSEEDITDFMDKEFAKYPILLQEDIKNASPERKLEIIEDEIRELYKDATSLKKEMQKQKEKRSHKDQGKNRHN